MYAHPSFIRNKPEALLYLQKSTSRNKQDLNSDTTSCFAPRSVSPSLSHMVDDTNELLTTTTVSTKNSHFSTTIVVPGNQQCWQTNKPLIQNANATPVSPPSRRALSTSSESDASSTGSSDRGKLDLLAFALEQEIACYH
jgi:hypothetical protein